MSEDRSTELAPCILAVGAHADDIELNVGGTLAKYRASGYRVVYVMSTNNMSGSWKRRNAQGQYEVALPPYDVIQPQRKKETHAAAAFYGTLDLHLDHPQRHYTRHDGGVEKLRYGCQRPDCVKVDQPSILTAYEHAPSVKQLAELILQHRPEAILSHSMITGNIEHVGSCLLVSAAYEQCLSHGYQGSLLYWNDLTPAPVGRAWQKWDTFIDVSDFWDAKLQAIAFHACQIPDTSTLDFPPHGQACGCRYSEVFTLHSTPREISGPGLFTKEIRQHLLV